MAGPVETRVTISRETDVDPALGIDASDTSQDAWLDLMIIASKQAADDFLNNPFTDDAGDDETIPNYILEGCIEWIRSRYTVRLEADMSRDGVAERKARDVHIKYRDSSSPNEQGLDLSPAEVIWWPRRLAVGF